VIEITLPAEVAEEKVTYKGRKPLASMTKTELEKLISQMEHEMRKAARELAFERAAEARDLMIELRKELLSRSRKSKGRKTSGTKN